MIDNPDTSRGIILELLFNVGSTEASIQHNIETHIFLDSDLRELSDVYENVDTNEEKEEINKKISNIEIKKERLLNLIKSKTKTRQIKMRYLEHLCKDYDKRMHCSVKHWTKVIETDTEILVNNVNRYTQIIIIEDYKSFAEEISLYLGIDYTDCFRCLADSLIIGENNENQ